MYISNIKCETTENQSHSLSRNCKLSLLSINTSIVHHLFSPPTHIKIFSNHHVDIWERCIVWKTMSSLSHLLLALIGLLLAVVVDLCPFSCGGRRWSSSSSVIGPFPAVVVSHSPALSPFRRYKSCDGGCPFAITLTILLINGLPHRKP